MKMVAWWKEVKAESGSVSGYLFLTVISFNPLLSMQGRRVLFFLFTKKNPAPTGDEGDLIRPAAKESVMYFCVASLSGLYRLYNLLDERGAPGRRSILQS